MEIKFNKCYFTKQSIKAFEFGKTKEESIQYTLNKLNGVFLIGEDELNYCFQIMMPIFIGGKETYLYIEVPKIISNELLQSYL